MTTVETKMPKRVLAVIACAAIVAGILAYIRSGYVLDGKADIVRTTAECERVRIASEDYHQSVGVWPTSFFQIVSSEVLRDSLSENGFIIDSWGQPIVYEPYDAEKGCGRVVSRGPDGLLRRPIVVTFGERTEKR